jgi:HK97 family phage portal protein
MAENQNLFGRIVGAFRNNPNRPSTSLSNPAEWLMSGNDSATGIAVTENSAMQLSAVFGAVRVISETMASLPWNVKQTKDGVVVNADAHPINKLIHQPNVMMTDFTFRETCQAHLCLHGNAFIAIQRNEAGQPKKLIPIHPDRVQVKVYKEEKFYTIDENETFDDSEMIHLVGLSFDGIVGKSVLEAARESIGLGLAADRFGGSFFGNGANVSAVLTHPGRLSDEAYKRLMRSWTQRNSGLENSHKTAILEEGMSVEKMSISPQESQFISTRKFGVEDIARFFRIPLAYLGSLENSSTRANVEEQGIMFQRNTILPWVKRWESEFNRKLFITDSEYYIRFNMDGILRGDIRSRYEAYTKGRQWGWLSANDVLKMENMAPIVGGDAYLQPMNMIDVNSSNDSQSNTTENE